MIKTDLHALGLNSPKAIKTMGQKSQSNQVAVHS